MAMVDWWPLIDNLQDKIKMILSDGFDNIGNVDSTYSKLKELLLKFVPNVLQDYLNLKQKQNSIQHANI